MCRLSLGTYDDATSAATSRTAGRATAGASTTAGAAATVAIMPLAVVAPAKPGPRMTFVLAGKGGG
jgi:hypothetical protein